MRMLFVLPRPITARTVNCCVSWNGWMPGQGSEGTPWFCLSVKPLFLMLFSNSFSQKLPNPDTFSSPTAFHCHFIPFLPVSLKAECCSCLCRALRLINARTHKISFLFYSFSFSLTVFKRLSPAEKNSCVHPVWSVALILMCTAFLAGRLHKGGWDVPKTEPLNAQTVCPDRATGAETAAYIIP